MFKRRIVSVPKGISWEDFQNQFWKFFPLSSIEKRVEKLRLEYERLTGKKPHGKDKTVERELGQADSGRNNGKDNGTRKSSRRRGNESEHGSAVVGDGLGGQESAKLQRDISKSIRETEGADKAI